MDYGNIVLLGFERIYPIRYEKGGGPLKRMKPFVGIRGRRPHAVLGIGFRILIDNEPNMFWGVDRDQYDIVQVWRAMKLLERVGWVDNQGKVLVASLALFDNIRLRDTLDEEYIRELASQFGGLYYLSMEVNRIKATFPSEMDLDILIHEVHDAGIPINISTLKDEMRHFGRDINTPVVYEVSADYEKLLAARKEESLWENLLSALARSV